MIAWLAPLAVQAAMPGFAPPLDRPIAYTVSETRIEGVETRRFAVERRVTFRAAGEGFIAEVETLSAGGDAGRAGQLFASLAHALVGKRIVLTLDRAGKVVDVADLDTLWSAQLAAVSDTLKARNPAHVEAFDAMLAPLRAMPRAAKVARMGEMIVALIAEAPVTAIASRQITLPARGQDGTPALLAGSEQATVGADGMVFFERRASGAVKGTPMTVSQRRRIDTRTGLIVESINTSTIETAGGRLIVTRSTAIKP